LLEGLIFIFIFFMIFDLYKKNRDLRDRVEQLTGNKPLPKAGAEAKKKEKPAPTPVAELSEARQALREHPIRPVPAKPADPEAARAGQGVEDNVKAPALFEALKRFLTGGNLLVKVGGIVFFLGLVFLVKYAAEHNMISIEVRLIAVAVGALVLVGIGWRLRKREGYYGLILQALGVAAFYLVVFASAKLYGLLTMPQAFFIMLIVVVFGSLLAVAQDAVVLALFSVTGGFLVPILTSDGSGSHIVLFSYYAFLNIGIFLIAWYRSWRVLNIVGFFFTFVIAVTWGVLRYEPALFATTEPFLIFFFLLYLGVSILFTAKQPFKVRAFIDATLVFGLPLVAFSLQASMIERFAYGVFYSAVAAGTLYLVLYRLLSHHEKMHMLSEAFLAIAVVFYTVAFPYALDDDITGALWALEAAAVIWISLKYGRRYGVLFGIALEFAAMVLYTASTLTRHAEYAFANGIFLGYVIIVAAACFSAYLFWLQRTERKDSVFNTFAAMFLGAGLLIWLLAGILEAHRTAQPFGNVILIYAALSAVIFAVAAVRSGWSALEKTLQFYLPLGMLFFSSLIPHYIVAHPFEGIGSVAFVLFFLVHYGLLARFESKWVLNTFLHTAGLLVAALILSRELQYATAHLAGPGTLSFCAFALLPMLLLVVIAKAGQRLPALIRRNMFAYDVPGGIGLAAIVAFWELNAVTRDGAVSFMPYVPLLSPLDLFQAAGMLAIVLWVRHVNASASGRSDIEAGWVAGIFVFVYATVLLGRGVHFYGGVDYTMIALRASLLYQALLSILWSSMGIAVMLMGKRAERRSVWIAGAVVLAVVVLKLFLVDLAGSGTVERIVSFISVGTLLLVVGYFAPIPPLEKSADAEA
jgi:uncharacterized membrane protein